MNNMGHIISTIIDYGIGYNYKFRKKCDNECAIYALNNGVPNKSKDFLMCKKNAIITDFVDSNKHTILKSYLFYVYCLEKHEDVDNKIYYMKVFNDNDTFLKKKCKEVIESNIIKMRIKYNTLCQLIIIKKCDICWLFYDINDDKVYLITLPCGHMYHIKCYDLSYEYTNYECPSCLTFKKEYIEKNKDKIKTKTKDKIKAKVPIKYLESTKKKKIDT